MEKTIKAIGFDGKTGVLEPLEVDNALPPLREYLRCDYIEIVPVMVANRRLLAIIDEEGKINGKQRIASAIFVRNGDTIVDCVLGRIIFTRDDGEGELASVHADDIEAVRSSLIPAAIVQGLPVGETLAVFNC